MVLETGFNETLFLKIKSLYIYIFIILYRFFSQARGPGWMPGPPIHRCWLMCWRECDIPTSCAVITARTYGFIPYFRDSERRRQSLFDDYCGRYGRLYYKLFDVSSRCKQCRLIYFPSFFGARDKLCCGYVNFIFRHILCLMI